MFSYQLRSWYIGKMLALNAVGKGFDKRLSYTKDLKNG